MALKMQKDKKFYARKKPKIDEINHKKDNIAKSSITKFDAGEIVLQKLMSKKIVL